MMRKQCLSLVVVLEEDNLNPPFEESVMLDPRGSEGDQGPKRAGRGSKTTTWTLHLRSQRCQTQESWEGIKPTLNT